MKFKTGFMLGVAAGAWVANKASGLQGSQASGSPSSASSGRDEAAEKLRALSGLARERLSDFIEGPLGHIARDRLADLIGTSLGARKGSGSDGGSAQNGSIDTTASWPD